MEIIIRLNFKVKIYYLFIYLLTNLFTSFPRFEKNKYTAFSFSLA